MDRYQTVIRREKQNYVFENEIQVTQPYRQHHWLMSFSSHQTHSSSRFFHHPSLSIDLYSVGASYHLSFLTHFQSYYWD